MVSGNKDKDFVVWVNKLAKSGVGLALVLHLGIESGCAKHTVMLLCVFLLEPNHQYMCDAPPGQ